MVFKDADEAAIKFFTPKETLLLGQLKRLEEIVYGDKTNDYKIGYIREWIKETKGKVKGSRIE